MSRSIKLQLYKKIARTFDNTKCSANTRTAFSHSELKHDRSSGQFSITLPLKTKDYDIQNAAEDIVKMKSDDIVENVSVIRDGNIKLLAFQINRDNCIKEILECDIEKIPVLELHDSGKRILVEYSSPNIAKPFHVGHLRSTIIGNYIANLNSFVDNNVNRVNYLGDWGTQFGFLQLGINLSDVTDETMRNDSIKVLYNAYVHANKLAAGDIKIADQARKIFKRLESGDSTDFHKWETFRKYTVDELKRTYKRLGVSFDEYNWESMYSAKEIGNVISRMEERHLLVNDEKNRKVIGLDEKRSIPIIKSDGTTLYITRDIAAAIDRFDKYAFDEMYYVVDNAQTDHFLALSKILKKMELPWADRLKHVKFGRIRGMSTRKGTAVFLKDILDETQAIMREKQMQSPTTKTAISLTDQTADILGVSAVIINDLKQRRQRDYEFDWNRALDIKGDTGVKLQYAHCRLVNLEKNSGAKLASECDSSLLKEPIVGQLVAEIGKFDEIIFKSHQELESCILVNYLFGLSNTVNKALKTLRIKGEPSDIGSQRLLLFHNAKKVLGQGMKLLGLTPLNEM